MRPWVVKLGGSLFDARSLREWLAAIATAPRPIVVVPGGGPFAEAVRRAQPAMGFGDGAAHRMAILAMEQYGHALADIEPRLRLASNRFGLVAGGSTVWLPAAMLLARDDLPESWELTSDSLAAWLAAEIAAEALVLVKAAALPDEDASAEALAARGVIDAEFPRMLWRFRGRVACVGQADLGRFAAALDGGPLPGIAAAREAAPGPAA